jgi:hypothetical protein
MLKTDEAIRKTKPGPREPTNKSRRIDKRYKQTRNMIFRLRIDKLLQKKIKEIVAIAIVFPMAIYINPSIMAIIKPGI